MDNNEQILQQHDSDAVHSSCRRRTPSRYYTSIRELTKLHARSSKKEKNQSPIEDEELLNSNGQADRDGSIYYILPGKTRKMRLSVIIRKQPKPAPKMRKISSTANISPPEKKQKEPPKKNCLLDTLLEVVNKIQNDENSNEKPEENPKNQTTSPTQQDHRREYKMRKQKEEEEKYLRFYQKYQGIVEKLEDMERQLVFI